jgi:alpha-tubulin suppressor-like RCC1 family protein
MLSAIIPALAIDTAQGIRSIDCPCLIPGSNATALTTGQWHGCTVLTDGSVRCWGNNDYGQLGTGDTVSKLVPTQVVGLSTGAPFTSLSNPVCC